MPAVAYSRLCIFDVDGVIQLGEMVFKSDTPN